MFMRNWNPVGWTRQLNSVIRMFIDILAARKPKPNNLIQYIDLYSPTCGSKENVIHTYIIINTEKYDKQKSKEKQHKKAMGKF